MTRNVLNAAGWALAVAALVAAVWLVMVYGITGGVR